MAASGTVKHLRDWMGRKRFGMACDLVLLVLAQIVLLSIVLNWRDREGLGTTIIISVVVGFFALWRARAHRHVWSRVALEDVFGLLAAGGVVALVTAVVVSLQVGSQAFSRVLLGGIVTYVCAWSAPRLLLRLWFEARQSTGVRDDPAVEPVLVYGSGRRAEQFIKFSAADPKYRVVGFLHDDPGLRGRRLRGVDSLGGLDSLGSELDRLRDHGVAVKRLIVAEDGERPNELAAALDVAAQHGLVLCRLPSLLSLVEAGRSGDIVKAVSIEDILHRDQISINDVRVPQALSGKTVLVTGAGGSIGSELVRQIAAYGPARLVLVEFSEFNLYSIDHELAEQFPRVSRQAALCDVRDRAALEAVFRREKPDIVLHAAALKHVPLLEDHPDQAILTNIAGTHNVATLAREYGAEIVTLVSTDKAVNPTNVMGCTKRWAEMICQSFDADRDVSGYATRYACVRFGNVLDSAGSVVPLFRQQIAAGGPLTVTHEDITRYFMTIPEACELILVATGVTAQTRPDASQVFVLDMGEPVKIVDLAERMIQLHGLRPHQDIQIRFTGLRPGEKLYEELAHDAEALVPAPFPKASLARARGCSAAELDAAFADVISRARDGTETSMIDALRRLVPEYAPGAPRADAAQAGVVAAE